MIFSDGLPNLCRYPYRWGLSLPLQCLDKNKPFALQGSKELGCLPDRTQPPACDAGHGIFNGRSCLGSGTNRQIRREIAETLAKAAWLSKSSPSSRPSGRRLYLTASNPLPDTNHTASGAGSPSSGAPMALSPWGYPGNHPRRHRTLMNCTTKSSAPGSLRFRFP